MELPEKIKEWLALIRFLPINYVFIVIGLILTPFDQSGFTVAGSPNYFQVRLTHILLMTGIILLVVSEILWRIKRLYYRTIYPIEKLNKKFHLINIGGTVFVYDNSTGNYRWVENYTTYLDLGFGGYCEVTPNSKQSSNPTISRAENLVYLSPTSFVLKKYTAGKGIRTRGNPND